MKQVFRRGFTLMEVLITFTLLCSLALAAIFLLNPAQQFAKAQDARRKNDLNELRKIFESWIGDKGCYPKASDVCYNPSFSTTCNICTSHSGSPSLSTYTSSVLCDPESPRREYLYEVQGDLNCPTAFVIYSKLTEAYEANGDIFHCTKNHGCGPAPLYGYDWLVTSPNAAISVVSNYFCYTSTRRCSSCGSYTSCQDSVRRGACQTIYTSKTACCSDYPGAAYCP